MNITKQHPLLAPIGALSAITMKALTYGEDNDLTKQATKDGVLNSSALSWLRLEKAAGLTTSQLDDMATPDINVIKHFVGLTIASDAQQVADKLALRFVPSAESMVVNLLAPLFDDTSCYSLRYPTGRLTKMIELEPDDERRTLMLCEFCTGLSELQLKSMSTPDWNSLQAVLENFLGKLADYFRSPTLSD